MFQGGCKQQEYNWISPNKYLQIIFFYDALFSNSNCACSDVKIARNGNVCYWPLTSNSGSRTRFIARKLRWKYLRKVSAVRRANVHAYNHHTGDEYSLRHLQKHLPLNCSQMITDQHVLGVLQNTFPITDTKHQELTITVDDHSHYLFTWNKYSIESCCNVLPPGDQLYNQPQNAKMSTECNTF